MDMTQLTEKQQNQEAQYLFPYHYLDLASDHHKLLWTIEYLDLLKPVYRATAAYGHFGRDGFTWERVDKVDELKAKAEL